MYDAIVVGARCGGAPTALLLARRGYRVLLVDRAAFPSDTISTHWIGYEGLVRLQRWGLLELVAASNCPPTLRRVTDQSGARLDGTIQSRDGLPPGYAPRRFVLDALLVNAAMAAGAEFRQGFAMNDLLCEDGRVSGVIGPTTHGGRVVERARIVVGADGRNSRVAQLVGAPAYSLVPASTCAYYTYWADTAVDGLYSWSSSEHRRYQIAFPTNDGLVCLLIGWPRSEFQAVRANLEAEYLRALDLAPEIAERVRCGRRAERISGTADLPNFFRRPFGPGWALVGDAGHHKDPMQARGIRDAFRDAELLVEAIDTGHSGDQPLDVALAVYEQQRNAAALPLYETLCRALAFPAVSEAERRLVAALSEDQTSPTACSDCALGR
jgi:flavin-dependent dehydrogenase